MMDSPFYGRSYRSLPSRNLPSSVREIPVQFFGSEEKRPSRSDSAVKIQKVFRGYLVRKSVNKIKEIRNEVEEIDNRISKEETVDLIARDSKERLRINEMLMSLLFRLDSVRGVDSGVRDCRKTAIKKAIALQEILDAVVSSNNNNNKKNDQSCEKVREAVQDQNQNYVGDRETVKDQNDDGEATENNQADSSANPEEDKISSAKQENNATETHDHDANLKESRKNGELMERMVEDNERMMDLMTQLFERNEMQSRLLSSLSQRVEQLERAFTCEWPRRKKQMMKKKKKRQAAVTVDGCETSPDYKNCVKRR